MTNNIPAEKLPDGPRRAGYARWAAAAVVATAIFLYAPSINNDYTHDDLWALRGNPYYRANQVLYNLFSHNYFRMSAETTYRPLVTASYALDHMLWTRALPKSSEQWTAAENKKFVEDNFVRWRVGMHVHNVLLHAVNCLLLFLLVSRLWNARAAFIAAMLFTLHPIQAEVVNAVGYREDLQATLFVLLTAHAFLIWRSRAALPVAALCYALALLAKESAGPLPAALFAVEMITRRRKFSFMGILRAYGGFAAVALLYLCVRFWWMYNPNESQVEYLGGSFGSAFLTMWPNLLRELRLIILPLGLSVHYDIVPSLSPLAPEVLIAWAYLGALAAALIVLLRKRRLPAVPAGFAWYFIMILPTCNLLPIPGIVNDRYMYLPIIGLCVPAGIGLAMAWERLRGGRRAALGLAVAALFLVYAALTSARTHEWRDERALSLSTIKTNPRSIPSWLNYGNDCMERGDLETARKSLQHLAGIRPDSALALGQLGHVLEKLGEPEEAERAYRAALKRDPGDIVALNSLGLLRMKQRRYEEAIDYFQKVIDHEAGPELLVNLATALSFIGKRPEAEEVLLRAVKECPYAEAAHNALGNMYYRTGRFQAALAEHRRALALSPGLPEVLENIATDLMALERHAEAVPYLRRALAQRSTRSLQEKLERCLAHTGKGE